MKRRIVSMLGIVALALAASVGVWAFWTSGGTGSASASVGTLDAPTNVSAQAANATTNGPSPVAVSWDAPSGGTVAPTGYYVTRIKNSDSSTAAACDTSPAGTTPSTYCSDSSVPDGTYHYLVTAVYHSWTAVSAAGNDVTVLNRVTTTTALASSHNPSVVGEQVTYTATVTTGSLGTPTGNVEFLDGVTPIAGCGGAGGQAVNGSAQATCQVTYTAPAGHSISAQYLGDTNHFESTSNTIAQVVNKADTTTTVSSNHAPSVFGQSVTLTATVAAVAPGAGTPTGTVNFKDGGSTIAGCATQALSGGLATCTLSSLSVASHTITAVYSNDGSFNASTSPDFAQVVNKADTTTTVSSNHAPSVFGQSVTLTATVAAVAPGAGTPTGTVNFKDGGSTIAGCATQALSGGLATCALSSLAVASHTITAVYSNDGNFNGSTSADFTQTVNKADTTTTVSSNHAPSVFGQSVTLTATVAAAVPGAGMPTGTANFKDGLTTISGCGAQALSAGQATCVTSSLSVGSHTITAVYSNDGSFNASTSANFSQTVNQASTTTSVSSSANPSATGQQVTYTATVSVTAPGAGTPGGTVSFKDGASTITCESGSAAFNGTTATCKATYASASGSPHSITAVYSGDTSFSTSTSSALSQVVNAPDTFALTNPGTQTAGTPFSVTITAKSGAATDTSYTGTRCLAFSGPLSSPGPTITAPAYPARGACGPGESSVTFVAGVSNPIPSFTLYRASSSTTLTATQGAITGSTTFAVNSAGVALSYSPACPGTVPKNGSTVFMIQIPVDPYGNAFTSASGIVIGLSLSNTSNFVFGSGGTSGTLNQTITTGPTNNTFMITETGGGGKTSTLTATVPSPFSGLASCTLAAS